MFYKLLCLMTVFVIFFFINLNKVYALSGCGVGFPGTCSPMFGCDQSCDMYHCDKVTYTQISIDRISASFWISNSPDCINVSYGPFDKIPYDYKIPVSPDVDGSLYITNLPATIDLSDVKAEHYSCQMHTYYAPCCPWTTGAFGACAGGVETRTVSCTAPNGHCCGAAPSTTQACACGPYLACCPPGSFPDWAMRDGMCQPSCGYALVNLNGKADINWGCDSLLWCHTGYFYTAGTYDCDTCCENNGTPAP